MTKHYDVLRNVTGSMSDVTFHSSIVKKCSCKSKGDPCIPISIPLSAGGEGCMMVLGHGVVQIRVSRDRIARIGIVQVQNTLQQFKLIF